MIEIPPETKRKAAYDFRNTGISVRKIAEKHNISESSVRRLVKRIDPRSLEPEEDMIVIKVNRAIAKKAKRVLIAHDVPFEIPEKFELIEMYESKINQQTHLETL